MLISTIPANDHHRSGPRAKFSEVNRISKYPDRLPDADYLNDYRGIVRIDETAYQGSQAEAYWYLMFRRLGIQFTRQPEQTGVYYWPDFWLYGPPEGAVLVEVRSENTLAGFRQQAALQDRVYAESGHTGWYDLLLLGRKHHIEGDAATVGLLGVWHGKVMNWEPAVWAWCAACERLAFAGVEQGRIRPCGHSVDPDVTVDLGAIAGVWEPIRTAVRMSPEIDPKPPRESG